MLLVAAIIFLDTMFFTALTPLLPHYADELGIGKTGAGLLQAAYPIGTFLGAIPSGMVAAQLGPKRTVLGGLAALAVSSLAFAFAGSEWQLDTARFVQGLSSSFSWTGGLAWLVALAPAGRRGRLIGAVMGVAIGGGLFGPALGGIASVAGSRLTFSAVGAVAAALLAWAALTASAAPERPQPVSMLARALRSRSVVAAAWLVSMPALLFGALSVLAPLRLSALGYGALAITATWVVVTALEAVLAPVLGHVSDRIGRRRPLLWSLAASTVALVALPWPRHALLLSALVVGSTLAFGSFWTPAMALLSDAGEEAGLDHGYSFALINLAWAPGQATGSALGGALAAATADAVPYLALAGVCALTLAGLWRSAGSS